MEEETVPTGQLPHQEELGEAAPADAPKPRRRRTRTPKATKKTAQTSAVQESAVQTSATQELVAQEPVAQEPVVRESNVQESTAQEEHSLLPQVDEEKPVSQAPSVAPVSEGGPSPERTAQQTDSPDEEAKPKKRTRRRRKADAASEPASADLVAAVTEMAMKTNVPLDAMVESAGPQDQLPIRKQDAGAESETKSEDAGEHETEHTARHRRHVTRDQHQGEQRSGQQTNGRNRRNRRNKNNQDKPAEPSLTLDELTGLKVADLRVKAAELGVDFVGKRKKELAEEIYAAAAAAEGFRSVEGVLQMQPEGYAFLRTGNFAAGDDDAFVFQQMLRQYALRPGDRIKGTVGPGRSGSKFPPLIRIDTINGKTPDEIKHRPRFRDLTPIYPNERLVMEHGKDSITGRAIDLVAPIGKGQRGLIVSPPKAGKTTVLKKICQSIAANNPEVHLFCLLVDERPEEVTDMERSIRGDVVASTFDMPASNHTAVAEMVIEHAKRLVELGEDVVVVLDSITRLARAYNLAQPASGRILSGGVDSAALYPPKKFLGAARNIESGGSLTILASALVDTGSKMDEVIFEEFKGTGNMELKLDRDLADRRIFPAIDPVASGTRNEDLLIDPELQPFIWGIRRVLANMNNTERAATALVKGLHATNDNQEFLIRSAKKAAQSEYVA